jgi:hypothetical protein
MPYLDRTNRVNIAVPRSIAARLDQLGLGSRPNAVATLIDNHTPDAHRSDPQQTAGAALVKIAEQASTDELLARVHRTADGDWRLSVLSG